MTQLFIHLGPAMPAGDSHFDPASADAEEKLAFAYTQKGRLNDSWRTCERLRGSRQKIHDCTD